MGRHRRSGRVNSALAPCSRATMSDTEFSPFVGAMLDQAVLEAWRETLETVKAESRCACDLPFSTCFVDVDRTRHAATPNLESHMSTCHR